MGATEKSVSNKKNSHPDMATQRYLPFSEIRDNLMIMKDGSARMVLKVQAINFSLKSTAEQDSIIYSYQRFLNALKFPIQILVRSLKVDIEGYITRLQERALKQKNPLLQEQTYKYMEYLLNLVDMAQIMKKDFYIIIPHDEENGASVNKQGVSGIFTNFFRAVSPSQNVDKIREQRAKVERLKKATMEKMNTIKGSLEGIGLKSHILEKDELIKLLISHYNPTVEAEINIRERIEDFNLS